MASSLSVLPVASMVSESVATSTTLARNSCTISSTWLRVPASARTLMSMQLALHRGLRLELDDLEHLDELVELLGHLLQRQVLDVDDDGHPGDVRVLGLAHRERVDVEPAAGEQRGDPGQDAGLVLDEDGQGVLGHGRAAFSSWEPAGTPSWSGSSPCSSASDSSRSHCGAVSRATWIRSLLAPAATIGQTMASRWTTKSTTTGRSLTSIALRGSSRRRPPVARTGTRRSP